MSAEEAKDKTDRELLEEATRDDFKTLLSLMLDAKAKAMGAPTNANLAAYDRAKKMLHDHQGAHEEKAHEEESQGDEQVQVLDWSDYTDTANKADVLRYLVEHGWQVKRQTFYNHCGDGKLKKNQGGLYTSRMVKKYAQEYLINSTIGEKVADAAVNLAAQKTKNEIERIRTAEEHERFKLDILKGKYVLRADMESELVSRAVVLDSGLEYLFQSSVNEIIEICHGDQEFAPQLLEFLQSRKNEQMNAFANMGDFMVAVEPQQEERT